MSTTTVPFDPAASILEAIAAVTAAVRPPDGIQNGGATITFIYNADLTTAEAATLTGLVADVVAAVKTHDVELSVAEYQAIKPDIAGLRTYQGIASPTLAQTVSAVKAQSRILRALLRDG